MKLANKNIGWGILGCGKIAHKFAQDLLTLPNTTLAAVASRDIQKSQDFAKRHKALKTYGTYQNLCEDDQVEVIYIATPHVYHFEHSMLCLKAGKAVLCEKPFALNKDQVTQMIALATLNNVLLMEAMWTYFLPHYQHVLALIRSNELGAITQLKADFGCLFPFDPESRVYSKALGGGSLLDIGIYPVFAALSILGMPDNINAQARMSSTNVDESCAIEFNYRSGVTAILFSSITRETPTEAHITFERGSITIHTRFHQPSEVTIERNGVIEKKCFEVTTHGYSFEAAHVNQLLRECKTESPIMSFSRSLELMHVLDLIRKEIGLEY